MRRCERAPASATNPDHGFSKASAVKRSGSPAGTATHMFARCVAASQALGPRFSTMGRQQQHSVWREQSSMAHLHEWKGIGAKSAWKILLAVFGLLCVALVYCACCASHRVHMERPRGDDGL
jgi:hypothetical protein